METPHVISVYVSQTPAVGKALSHPGLVGPRSQGRGRCAAGSQRRELAPRGPKSLGGGLGIAWDSKFQRWEAPVLTYLPASLQ